MNNLKERLAGAISRIEKKDSQLASELQEKRERAMEEAKERVSGLVNELAIEGRNEEVPVAAAVRAAAVATPVPKERQNIVAETIVLRQGRPVLAIVNDEPRLDFRDVESEVWRERLTS